MTFVVDRAESNNFILKPYQAQILDLGTEAVVLTPYPTSAGLNAGSGPSIVTACTATAIATSEVTSTVSGSSGFTAGQLAGASVGVGVPLLIALILALFVIVKQKRRLRSLDSADTSPQQSNAYYQGVDETTTSHNSQGQVDQSHQLQVAEMNAMDKQEMAAEREAREIDGLRRTAELSSGGSRARG